MEGLLKEFVRGDAWVASFGIGFVVVLLALLHLLLPSKERKLLKLPLLLLALHVAGVVLVRLLPEGDVRRPIAFLSLIFLLAALGRSLVLLVLDVILGRRLVRPLPRIIRDITQGIVYLAVLFAALRASGVEPGSILATSALLTAVIGLSLQETLGNMFAGLAIQLQRPFDVGDWIEFDNESKHVGRVVEINWRATKLMTLDEVEVIVPNASLAKAAIRNFTKPSEISRRSVYVMGPYDVPPRQVHQAILEAIVGTPGVVEEPAPTVVTNTFADSGIEYWVRFFTDQYHRRDWVDGAVRDRIWYAFHRDAITIPFPHRTVHILENSEESRARATEALIDKRDQALQRVTFLNVVPPDHHRSLAAKTKTRLFAAGETIVKQGATSTELFIIERGEVQVLLARGDGPATEVARLGPGKFFGETAFVTGEPRNATVRALVECEVIVVEHDAFQEVLEAVPSIAEHISRVLAERKSELEAHADAPNSSKARALEDESSQILGRLKKFFSL